MKRTLTTLLGASAALALLAGCGSDPTVEDRVSEACLQAVEEHGKDSLSLTGPPNDASLTEVVQWESSRIVVTDLAFSDVEATAPKPSDTRNTKAWTVTGTVTAQRERRATPGQWDDDGKPEKVDEVKEGIRCTVGYRESDDAVVVFEYQLLQIRDGKLSGNSETKELVSMEPDTPASSATPTP
ncbi:hypothetical protein [Gordonia sihwensis]|uniref:Lipoprotein n=1 Tax=Gordonia sihwensis NBRC 108236 TaxID=1223544 RepID=L7LNA5_9ACTN|nr:hypothetical protein [Gordonia sihwensis]GAC61582.1 hypothetical protein GSI01S_19_00460 [Gordonia sihwensis NBRC 108236]